MVERTEISIYLEVLRYIFVEYLLLIPSILWSFLTFFLPKSRKNISGQLALITGGSEGIGRGIAFELAKNGCKIAIASRNIEKGNQTVKEIIEKFNVEAKAFKCDISKCEDVRKLKQEINSSLGTVDILVNNAGLLMIGNSLLEGDDERYQYCVDVNLTSWIWTTRTFLPDMIKQHRGHIVGISSASVHCPFPDDTAYIATKFGNKGFMDALRQDICMLGFDEFIKTSIVYPAFIKTNESLTNHINDYMLEPLLPKHDLDDASKSIVNGIREDRHDIYISDLQAVHIAILNYLPQRSKRRMILNSFRSDMRDEVLRQKFERSGLLKYYKKD